MENKYYQELFEKSLLGYGQDRQTARAIMQMVIKKAIRSPKRVLSLVLLAMISKLFNRAFKRTVKTFWGDEMTVVIPEHVSLRIFGFGYFEEGLTKMVLEYLKPGDVFFDIGTHIGYFTLLSSAIVGKNGQVHSFEPTPSTFAILQSNVEDKSNVILNNCAVFSKNTILCFNDYGTEYSAFNSFEENRGLAISNPQEFEVQAISLDEYIYSTKIVPDFIKIDAEGAEYEILTGGGRMIKDIQPIISIEVGGRNSAKCIHYLTERGYQAYEYKEGHIIRHRLRDRYLYDNILFLPEKVRRMIK